MSEAAFFKNGGPTFADFARVVREGYAEGEFSQRPPTPEEFADIVTRQRNQYRFGERRGADVIKGEIQPDGDPLCFIMALLRTVDELEGKADPLEHADYNAPLIELASTLLQRSFKSVKNVSAINQLETRHERVYHALEERAQEAQVRRGQTEQSA